MVLEEITTQVEIQMEAVVVIQVIVVETGLVGAPAEILITRAPAVVITIITATTLVTQTQATGGIVHLMAQETVQQVHYSFC